MTVERVQDRTQEFLGDLMGYLADLVFLRNQVEFLEQQLFGGRIRVSYGVAQYGIDMVMPKGSSGKSFAEMDDMDKREKRQLKEYKQFKSTIDVLERIAGFEFVRKDYKLRMIYELALSGCNMVEIGKLVSMDRRTVTKRIETIFIAAMQDELVETWLMYGVVDTYE